MKFVLLLSFLFPQYSSASYFSKAAHEQARGFNNATLVEQLNHPTWSWAYFVPWHIISRLKLRAQKPQGFLEITGFMAQDISKHGFRADYVKTVFDELLSDEKMILSLSNPELQSFYDATCGKLPSLPNCSIFFEHLLEKKLDQLSVEYLADILVAAYEPLVNEQSHRSNALLEKIAEVVVIKEPPPRELFKVARVIRILARMKEYGSQWLYSGPRIPATYDGAGGPLLRLRDLALKKVTENQPRATTTQDFMNEMINDVRDVAQRGWKIRRAANELVMQEDQFLLKTFSLYADDALVADFTKQVAQIAEFRDPEDLTSTPELRKKVVQAWVEQIKILRQSIPMVKPETR